MKSVTASIKTVKQLEDLLEGYGIETYNWGSEGNQSIEDLFDELQTSECDLVISEGKLIRSVRVAVIYIYFTINNIDNTNTLLKLREAMRIFKNEEGKYLNSNIVKRKYPGSIGTKIRTSEKPYDAAVGCVHRKLGTFTVKPFTNERSFTQNRTSVSYPNFQSNYETYEYDLFLDSTQYKSMGYCHEDDTSILILEWVVA